MNTVHFLKEVDSTLASCNAPLMYRVNVVLYTRTDNAWKFLPVRRTQQQRFIWDNPDGGVYYLEWHENRKRKRQTAGVRPAEVLEARRGAKFWNSKFGQPKAEDLCRPRSNKKDP